MICRCCGVVTATPRQISYPPQPLYWPCPFDQYSILRLLDSNEPKSAERRRGFGGNRVSGLSGGAPGIDLILGFLLQRFSCISRICVSNKLQWLQNIYNYNIFIYLFILCGCLPSTTLWLTFGPMGSFTNLFFYLPNLIGPFWASYPNS